MLIATTALVCAGCDPTNRAVWSPDGKHLAVVAADGLRLSDEQGNLSPVLLPSVELAAWLPGSNRLLIVKHEETSDWKRLSEVLSPEDLKTVLAESAKIRAAILAYKGNWDAFDKDDSMSDLRFGPEDIAYLRAHSNKELSQKMGNKWKELESLKAGIWLLELCDVTPHAVTSHAVIYKSARHIEDVRISPNAKHAAITESTRVEGGPTFRLSLLDLSSAKVRRISDLAAKYPDWSAHGKSVLYIDALQNKESNGYPVPGVLRKVVLLTDDLSANIVAPADLAEVVFRNNDRVRCLSDGRVLFSCPEIALPASQKDIKWTHKLFAIDPDKQSTVIRMVPSSAENQIGDQPEYFEPSPDGSKVSIPSHTGAISVLSLADGSVLSTAAPKEQPSAPFIPQWRSNKELCIFLPAENTGHADLDVSLWAIGPETQKRLSLNWPAEALKGFLQNR